MFTWIRANESTRCVWTCRYGRLAPTGLSVAACDSEGPLRVGSSRSLDREAAVRIDLRLNGSYQLIADWNDARWIGSTGRGADVRRGSSVRQLMADWSRLPDGLKMAPKRTLPVRSSPDCYNSAVSSAAACSSSEACDRATPRESGEYSRPPIATHPGSQPMPASSSGARAGALRSCRQRAQDCVQRVRAVSRWHRGAIPAR